jgi:integrase
MRKRKLPNGMVERPGREGYYCDFQINGKRYREFLGTELDTAEEVLSKMRSRAIGAKHGVLDNDMPIEELREKFELRCAQKLRPSTVSRYELSLNTILDSMKATIVSELTVDKVMRYRQQRLADKLSPRAINHDTTVLNAMLNWGVKTNKIGSNPLRGLEPLLNDNPKNRRPLSDHEVKALLEKTKEPWHSIWYAYLVTGMRANELIELRFSDLDFANRQIIVRAARAKGKRERRIPMDARLHEILKRQLKGAKSRLPGRC